MPKKNQIKNIIFPIEFDHFTGGMIHSVTALAKSLKKDYNVYILAHKEAEVLKIEKDFIPLILHNPWVISMSSPIKTFKTHLEVKMLMKPFKYSETLIFTNNVGSELIFSGFGFFSIPLKRIFISRGGGYTGKTGWVIKKGFKSVSQFIAISNRQVKVLLKSGVSESKITLIHNGILFQGSPSYKYSFNKEGLITISVIGYISHNKNQLLAVKAIAELLRMNYKVVLHIYGDTVADSDKIYKNFLEEEIKRLGVVKYVIFKGFEKDQNQIYQHTDILVSSSLSEGFGRTVAEAMAYGLPSIGLIESGGLLDIITNNHDGILIKNEENELVSAIVRIIEDECFRNKLSENAIETFKTKFREDIMIAKYNKLLNNFFNYN